MIADLLQAALVMTTPILLAALGGLVNRAAGVVNIGLDAMMLGGALVSLIVASASGSWLAALAAGALAGAAIGLLMSLAITRLEGDEIIVGLGITIATAGLVRYVLKLGYGVTGTLSLPGVARLPQWGGALFQVDPLTCAAWCMVPAIGWFLTRTRAGLRLRAAGAAPHAARAMGLDPLAWRDASSVFAGAMAGLAGAYLCLGVVGVFNQGITAGRGFIALAAFYFGRHHPWTVAGCALMFGLFDALQFRLQQRGLPVELVQALPYAMVIPVLVLMGRARAARRGGQA